MNIKKKILAKGSWGKNYTSGRTQKVKYLVVHYTSTGASALNNLKYFASRYIGSSAHLFIDPNGDLYQSVKLADTAWAVGAKSYRHTECRNSNSVSIEVVNAGKTAYTKQQIATLKSVVAELRVKYGIPASHVLRHYDVTGKGCPLYYCGSSEKDKRWKSLHTEITGSTPPKPSTPAFKQYKVKVTATSLIVRKGASTSSAKVKSLKKGTVVTVIGKAAGTSVGGNKTWLKIPSGYISEKYTMKV